MAEAKTYIGKESKTSSKNQGSKVLPLPIIYMPVCCCLCGSVRHKKEDGRRINEGCNVVLHGWMMCDGEAKGGGGVDHPNEVQQNNTQTDFQYFNWLITSFNSIIPA